MKPVDGIKPQSGRSGADDFERMSFTNRFEQALHRRESSDQGQDGGDQHDGSPESKKEQPPEASTDEPLPPSALRAFYQSLTTELNVDHRRQRGGLIYTLLEDIAESLKAGKHIRGDRWRLVLRLRSQLLERTELEIACTGGELCVVLRTASEDAYRRLVEALPSLNEVLQRHQAGSRPAAVFWVSAEELQ